MENDFAQAAVSEISPANMGKFYKWSMGVCIVFTFTCATLIWNSANNTKNIAALAITVSELSASTIRMEEGLKKNTEIDDLRHPQ